MNTTKLNYYQKGFTIVELIIATSVFSAIILIATTGITQIGKNYYKGITSARTQETARSIEDEVSRTLQVSGDTAILTGVDGDKKAICIGNTRYSYIIDRQLAETRQHVLWMDIKLPGSACEPLDINNNPPSDHTPPNSIDSSLADQSREMLATNMRLLHFNVYQVNAGLYKVELKLLYGHDDLIERNDPANLHDDNCKSSRDGGQFCATSELSSFVKKRL